MEFKFNRDGQNIPEMFNITLERGSQMEDDINNTIGDLFEKAEEESKGDLLAKISTKDLIIACEGLIKDEKEINLFMYYLGSKIRALREEQKRALENLIGDDPLMKLMIMMGK